MTKLYTLLFLLSSANLFAQPVQSTLLDTNNIAANLLSTGHLFTEDPYGHGFEVPKGGGNHVIYGSHIWMGGLDGNGQLHLAGEQFFNIGNKDFWTGPVATVYDSLYDNRYNRFWEVSWIDIQKHLNGISTTPDIMDWPAHGNVANGEAADLAPFVDVNNNGQYEPTLGDYPMFKGDKAVFMILNDTRDVHGATAGDQLGVEVHVMVYQYETNDFLNNTTFVNYSIFNRSSNTYSGFYLAHFDDFDLGGYEDDYVGSSPARNTYFAYNGDNFDGPGGFQPGYDSLTPAIGVTFLNQNLRSFKYMDRLGAPAVADPSTAIEYYQYLQGIWLDGAQMVVGGNGHPSHPDATSQPSLHMFPGDVTDTSQWSDVSAGNPPGDRRGLGTSNPMTFSSGDNICLDLAYTFYRSDSVGHLNSVIGLLDRVDSVQAFYDSLNHQCNTAPVVQIDSTVGVPQLTGVSTITIYPNPTTGQLWIELDQPATQIRVLDATGKLAYSGPMMASGATQINLSDLAPGIHFIRVFRDHVLLGQEKIVILK